MTFVMLGRLCGLGDVEAMIGFCDLISPAESPYQLYHAEFLQKELFKLVQFWPVDLHPWVTHSMIWKTYKNALRKHNKTNPLGVLPKQISYYPRVNILRYRNGSGVIFTLDMTTHLVLIQSLHERIFVRYKDAFEHALPPMRLETSRVFLPSQIAGSGISLGEALDMIRF